MYANVPHTLIFLYLWFYTHPNCNPHNQGNSSNKLATTATVSASIMQGPNAREITVLLSFFKATGSSSNPERNNITTKAIFRNATDQLFCISSATLIACMFVKRSPANSIPRRFGSWRHGRRESKAPSNNENTKITNKPNRFPPGKFSLFVTVNVAVHINVPNSNVVIKNPVFPEKTELNLSMYLVYFKADVDIFSLSWLVSKSIPLSSILNLVCHIHFRF